MSHSDQHSINTAETARMQRPEFSELLRRHLESDPQIGLSELAEEISPKLAWQVVQGWRDGRSSPGGRGAGEGDERLEELIAALRRLKRRAFTEADAAELRDACFRKHSPRVAEHFEGKVRAAEARAALAEKALSGRSPQGAGLSYAEVDLVTRARRVKGQDVQRDLVMALFKVDTGSGEDVLAVLRVLGGRLTDHNRDALKLMADVARFALRSEPLPPSAATAGQDSDTEPPPPTQAAVARAPAAPPGVPLVADQD